MTASVGRDQDSHRPPSALRLRPAACLLAKLTGLGIGSFALGAALITQFKTVWGLRGDFVVSSFSALFRTWSCAFNNLTALFVIF